MFGNSIANFAVSLYSGEHKDLEELHAFIDKKKREKGGSTYET